MTVDAWGPVDDLLSFLKRSAASIATLAFLVVLLLLLFGQRAPESQTTAQVFLFSWTGDDGHTGLASSMQIRWKAAAIVGTDTLGWWNTATPWVGAMPTPKPDGTQDSVTVLGLPNDTNLWAVMKICDEVPNCSGFSNVAAFRSKDFIPPAPVTNLRVGFAWPSWGPTFARAESDVTPPARTDLTTHRVAV